MLNASKLGQLKREETPPTLEDLERRVAFLEGLMKVSAEMVQRLNDELQNQLNDINAAVRALSANNEKE